MIVPGVSVSALVGVFVGSLTPRAEESVTVSADSARIVSRRDILERVALAADRMRKQPLPITIELEDALAELEALDG